MITNVGKNLLAKYLVGQTTSYASHIAIGCGPKPVENDYEFSNTELDEIRNKKTLDFEMLRMPIISRGFVDEDGLSKIVLTAELPTAERYEITEVGIFSAASNPVAGAFDSKGVYSFTDTDDWKYSQAGGSAVVIPSKYEPLDGEDADGTINTEDKVFATNADNRIFTSDDRVNRNERCRFLNNIVVMRGDTSTITVDGQGEMQASLTSDYIRLDSPSVNFSKNSPLDELRLAFSIVSRVEDSLTVPDNVKILIEFSHVGPLGTNEYAKFQVDIDDQAFSAGVSTDERDLTTNRYLISGKQFQNIKKTTSFSWEQVSLSKIYAQITKSGIASDSFYLCLDGLRLENVTSTNSLYGLTGYSVIKNRDERPIIKSANTTNYIEFRFALDV
jgi:hypothetical protein